MNKKDQRELLTAYMKSVTGQMLRNSDHWPEQWDGFELRWLVEAAILLETPQHNHVGRKRYKEFRNAWRTKPLY